MKKRTFTSVELETICTLYQQGIYANQIAEQFNTCAYVITRTLREQGFVVTKRIEPISLTEEQHKIIEAMYPTYTLDFIARHLKIGRELVTKHLRKTNTQIRSRGRQRIYHTVDGLKTCSQCKQSKSVNEFSRHADTYDGLQPACRICSQQSSRIGRLDRKFGITETQYREMLKAQNGVCAICGQPETRTKFGKPTRLAVDHNHKNNTVRELICFRCNVVIGRIEENALLCDKIKAYLLKHNGGKYV